MKRNVLKIIVLFILSSQINSQQYQNQYDNPLLSFQQQNDKITQQLNGTSNYNTLTTNRNLNQQQNDQQILEQQPRQRFTTQSYRQQQQPYNYNNVNMNNNNFYDNSQQTLYNANRNQQYDQQTNFLNYNQRNYDNYQSNYDLIDQSNYCPEYWITYRRECIRFIKSPKRNWFDAKKICLAYNSQLLTIDTIDKHSFIMKELILQNQKQNRYFISARQTTPGIWINDDNSQFIMMNDEDSIIYENNEQENLYDNQELLLRLQQQDDIRKQQSQNNYKTLFNRYDPNNQQQQLQQQSSVLQTSTLTIQQQKRYQQNGRYNNDVNYLKNRLIYGYSLKKDRWMFIPTFDVELNLFICESKQLYNVNNINDRSDTKRKIDYGLIVNDFLKMPHGPRFLKEPIDVTYDTSKKHLINDIQLSCLADGYPIPTYKWFKEEYINDTLRFLEIDPLNDDHYTLSGGNLIIYEPKQIQHQGVYHCTAKNRYGRIRSESVKLNFGYIMEFNLKRSPETGDMNWGKSLFCDPPQHYPGVKYYWSRDFFPNFVEEDHRVFVSNDGALYFSSLETVDRANYSCTVQSLVSDTGRNGPFFPLRVHPNSDYQALIFANAFPKVFPEAPIAGDEIRLECVAFGYPIPSYNWTRMNLPMPRNSYQINYNRVLIIPNAKINDNGEYICTIENNRISTHKSILINIQMKPNFTIPLRDQIKDLGSIANFICEAAAVPDVNYTWYKNGDRLNIEDLNRDRFVIQDNLLTIKYLDPDKDNGIYQCRAENQLKAVFSSAQLRVITMKPSFKKRPLESEIYAVYNGNTTILCDPEAAPRPKFQWKKDGNLIGPGGHRRILPTGTLIITPTSRDDEGVYTCVATNSNGTDESRARLIVLQELRFTEQLQPKIVTQIHQNIHLRCDVVYDPLLDVAFIWTHNGQHLKDEQNERFIIRSNSLQIRNITLLDTGEYECIAKSSIYKIVSRTYIKIEGQPGAPGGVSVIDVGKTTALIEWIDGTDNGRPIRFYNILGRTNWNKTWTNVSMYVQAEATDNYSGRRKAKITNLTPWSGYEFSVCAVNDLGVGKPSAPSPLYSTTEDKPYIAPQNVSGGGGKIGDLTITWKPLLPQEQNSHGIHYKIFWRLYGKFEWASQIIMRQEKHGMAVVHIPFDSYYTKYEVKVQAINNVGMGPESEIATIFSAEDMPQVAPQQPIAKGFNSTAINVTWDAVELTREKIRGKLIGHRLKYWKRQHAEEDAVYYLSRTTRPWALIVGLEPDTYYFVKVMAYNAAGEGPESERYLERTYRKAPQKPPSSVHIYGIDPSTVRVVWRYVAPTLEEEPIQGYKVRVWESDQDMSTANDTVVHVGNKLECYVKTLTPGKSYKMRVLAYSNGGDGRMSSPTLNFQMGNTKSVAANIKLNTTIRIGFLTILYLYKQVIF